MHMSVVLCQNISYCVLLCIHEAFATADNGVFMYCKNMHFASGDSLCPCSITLR